jgi:hypothetical protein
MLICPDDDEWVDDLNDDDWCVYWDYEENKKDGQPHFVELVERGAYIGSRIFPNYLDLDESTKNDDSDVVMGTYSGAENDQ